MAQNDYVIADQTASAALADINNALQSLASCSSGSSEPSVKYANMLWYDTAANILKIRNEANSAWISVVYVHQADNAVHILDNTYLSDTSGNHVGLLGDQATSEWTTGTGTTESLVSPAKIKAAIDNLAPKALGVGQSWQSVTRSVDTSYQNTTGAPIEVYCRLNRVSSNCTTYGYVSSDDVTFFEVSSGASTNIDGASVNFTVPNQHYYKITGVGTGGIGAWSELR